MCWIWYVFYVVVFNNKQKLIMIIYFISGVVRAVNKSTGDIYITTPVTSDILKHVNQFRLGKVDLPYTFYTEGTQNPKYVCVRQDSVLNENVYRQHKVML